MNQKQMIQDYINKMKDIQQNILEYIENNDTQNCFIDLNSFLSNLKFSENKNELKGLLRLTLNISNNHHNEQTFYNKIEEIIQLFKDEIKQFFSNNDIFNIFRSNKKILLFLFEQSILKPDKIIYLTIMSPKYYKYYYPHYFYPEFMNFFDDSKLEKIFKENQRIYQNREVIEIDSETYKQMRKIGENENYICQLIRNDSVVDFISYVNQTNFSLSSTIKKSIFEANSFLLKNNPSLIEYSAFYGSIQIFKYLISNKVRLSSSLWPFAIHGNNPELIHFLEENHIQPFKQDYSKCLIESIKCHHNEIANYILSNLLIDNDKKTLEYFQQCLKNYNFILFDDEFKNQLNIFYECNSNEKNGFEYNLFFDLCKFDYIPIVDILLKNEGLQINSKTI